MFVLMPHVDKQLLLPSSYVSLYATAAIDVNSHIKDNGISECGVLPQENRLVELLLVMTGQVMIRCAPKALCELHHVWTVPSMACLPYPVTVTLT